MDELIKKEKQLLIEPVSQLLNDLLLDGFKNRKGQSIVEVENFQFIEIEIDQDQSEIKGKIKINRVSTIAKVWVDLNGQGKSNNHLNLFTNKGFEVNYNFETKKYELDDVTEVILIDKTM